MAMVYFIVQKLRIITEKYVPSRKLEEEKSVRSAWIGYVNEEGE